MAENSPIIIKFSKGARATDLLYSFVVAHRLRAQAENGPAVVRRIR